MKSAKTLGFPPFFLLRSPLLNDSQTHELHTHAALYLLGSYHCVCYGETLHFQFVTGLRKGGGGLFHGAPIVSSQVILSPVLSLLTQFPVLSLLTQFPHFEKHSHYHDMKKAETNNWCCQVKVFPWKIVMWTHGSFHWVRESC